MIPSGNHRVVGNHRNRSKHTLSLTTVTELHFPTLKWLLFVVESC